MFTGIVTETGRIKEAAIEKGGYRLAIEAASTAAASKTGDSVSVSGVCLTVTAVKGKVLHFDAVKETVTRTTLKSASVGDCVNIEPSLKVGSSLGGHFVTGHVDYVGKIVEISGASNEVSIKISLPEGHAAMVARKGSIAVDGVSLTVGDVGRGSFSVYIIPHTIGSTTLGLKRKGDGVNVEFDIVGRYVARQREVESRSDITESFLRSNGF